MIAIACTPTRIYNNLNDTNKPVPVAAPRHTTKRHWRQCASDPCLRRSISVEEKLRKDISEYKMANKKLKSLAMWNLRSTRSALKDVEEMLQVIEDLYGEESFEE
jgi:hypothetical protein